MEINKTYIRCQRTVFGIQRTSQSKWNNGDFYIMLKHLFFFCVLCYVFSLVSDNSKRLVSKLNTKSLKNSVGFLYIPGEMWKIMLHLLENLM